MNNMDSFARRIERLAVRVEGNVESAVRECASAVAKAVIEATPANTGKAKSNWTAQLDAPASTERDAYSPGVGGSTSELNGQAAINLALQVIQRYRADQNRSINITNNLPYISALNDGHSKQAPAEFVRMAVFSGLSTVQKAKVLRD
jgi:Bacteriophage HK97-gp10, putative tail-component